MYNIIQLNDKNLSELQTIAQELGIKKTDSLKKEELVYKILDEQAIAGATKKVAADKLKEERKGEKQKRSRVTVKTVKKEGADKVFSANKNGNLTKAKTEEAPAAKEQPKTVEAPQEPTIEAATPAPAKEAAVPKRKPVFVKLCTQTQTGTPPQGKGRDCCTPSNGNPEGCRTGIELRG